MAQPADCRSGRIKFMDCFCDDLSSLAGWAIHEHRVGGNGRVLKQAAGTLQESSTGSSRQRVHD